MLEIWVPTNDQNRKRNVPTNSPNTATTLLRVLSARLSMVICVPLRGVDNVARPWPLLSASFDFERNFIVMVKGFPMLLMK